jgi:hypothetical protein
MRVQEERCLKSVIQLHLLTENLLLEETAETMQEIVMYVKMTSMTGSMKTWEIDIDQKMIRESQDVTQEIEGAVIAETELIK